MNYLQIGAKVVTVNVSDLAAMGAEAIGIILDMGLPPDMKVSDFDENRWNECSTGIHFFINREMAKQYNS